MLAKKMNRRQAKIEGNEAALIEEEEESGDEQKWLDKKVQLKPQKKMVTETSELHTDPEPGSGMTKPQRDHLVIPGSESKSIEEVQTKSIVELNEELDQRTDTSLFRNRVNQQLQ